MNNDFFNENNENEVENVPVSENTEPEEKNEAPAAETPVDSASASEDPKRDEHTPTYVNTQYRQKKTPAWLVVFLCVVGSLCLIVSSTFLYAFFKFSPSMSFFDDSSSQHDIIPENNVEEHLIQNESPVSKGAPTSDNALTVKQISQKVRTSVVGVTCQSAQSFSSSSVGSGIIMSSDGYVITNNHVIEGMTTISVVLDDGTTYPARLIGADARTDLAVIKIDEENLPAAEFGDSDKLEQGDPAIAIGNPAGLQLQNTVTSGIISAINRDIVIEDRTMTLIQTDASINPGNSGGPLVNEFGQVIGINTVKVGISYYEGLGFAIPINTAKPIIDELISNGYIKGRPSIGINGQSITERDAAFYGLPEGLYVEYVHPYSDAFKKGLRRGDVITKMNGTKLSSTAEIKQIRDNFKAGDEVTLTVYRNGKEVDIDIILMDEAALSTYGEQN